MKSILKFSKKCFSLKDIMSVAHFSNWVRCDFLVLCPIPGNYTIEVGFSWVITLKNLV